MRTERETWLDGLKGFGILLVIFGHVLSGFLDAGTFPEAYGSFYSVRTWIYSFHMPLFFVLSGFTFTLAYYREGKLRRGGFFRQLVSLFWIYTLFALLQWGIKQAVPELVNESYTVEDLSRMYLAPLGNFWYLYVLFMFYGLAALLRLPKWPAWWLPLFGGAAILAADAHLDWSRDTLTLYRILYHLPFFLLGSVLCRNRGAILSHKVQGPAVMFLATAACFYFFLYARHWYANWKFAIALSTCLVFTALFYCVPKLSGFPPLQVLGKYCLELYLLHTFFTGGFRTLLPFLGITSPWGNVLLNTVLSTGLSLAIALAAGRFWWMDILFRPGRLFARL